MPHKNLPQTLTIIAFSGTYQDCSLHFFASHVHVYVWADGSLRVAQLANLEGSSACDKTKDLAAAITQLE